MLNLRGAGASPFVHKVRIAAAVLELDDRIEASPADTFDPEDSLREQNPLGKIPALVLENGDVIFDSAVIVEYLDFMAGGGKVIPREPKARFRALTLQALADGISDAAVLQRYERRFHQPDRLSEDWLVHQAEKVERALKVLEADPPPPAPENRGDRACVGARLSRPSVRRDLAPQPPTASSPGSTVSPPRRRPSRRRGPAGEGPTLNRRRAGGA